MNVVLSEETQRLLKEQMHRNGYNSADEALRYALETQRNLELEEIDDETLNAIEEGLAQADRGEGRPWEEVREELRRKYITK